MIYANGEIPLSELVPLSVKSPTLGTQYATLRVAAAYERLGAKFKARFGEDLVPTEAYRARARQKLLRAAYLRYLAGGPYAPLAAIEGTSTHGWAEAIDFGSGVETYGTAEKEWLNKHGPEEGFYPTGDRFSPREAWHFDDKTVVPADTGIPTHLQEEEETMLRFITRDTNSPWFVTNGIVKRLLAPGENQYLVDLGLAVYEPGNKPKVVGGNLDLIPTAK